ncbi:High mobility group box domain [Arabidopsis thaliana x Arabidopsis arenosa]|uniref:High mobility group box domain n=1 Tax=Arabidopsis thaliana x Arabidopsis arenosa TaxID=1240361 RepID=A0A8T1XNC6_9BRAS|nr:High mobility group box domain [Arabidopsis thaliana x Arabidopsis arenosa]
MEEYKRTKEEEALSQKKEEEELLKLHKQEAFQLLKKKEKTDNLIKKEKATKKKKNENVDPNKPKKPASSYSLFSKDERKRLTEKCPWTNNSTELGEEEKQVYNKKAAKLMEAYKKEVEAYNKKSAATSSQIM